MKIFINRVLNMKKIHTIGFDMDHTLVRYHAENFEEFAYREVLKKLVEIKGYPQEILQLKFDFNLAIQGLVIDKTHGNLLKLSRFGKVKTCSHGINKISFQKQNKLYGPQAIDLSDSNIQSLDTSFSISNGVLYMQLTQLKLEGKNIPHYDLLAFDLREMIDLAHGDGTLKEEVAKNISKYIIREPDLVAGLEKYKSFGKNLIMITNSDYPYAKLLMDYTITPFLKNHSCWSELFSTTITLASKPRFFNIPTRFLKIDAATGMMSNIEDKITNGIYQGGWAGKLEKDLKISGDRILYLGDHIYGDVVQLKKTFNWRTALVLNPLESEVNSIRNARNIQSEIDGLMLAKEKLETVANGLEISSYKQKKDHPAHLNLDKVMQQLDEINDKISNLLDAYRNFFNPFWGEMMRAGQEESRFADQVEKYACIYMSSVTDLLDYSPKSYFRPKRRVLPHELV